MAFFRTGSLLIPAAALAVATAFLNLSAQRGDPDQGAQRFVEFCAACHGADGRGGDKARDLVTAANPVELSDADLLRIVRDGTREGMPPFAQIGDANIRAVVRYLRTLQGQAGLAGNSQAVPVSGDVNVGRALYFGKGECSSCHMIQGEGGFIASGLTNYGRNRTPDAILRAIENPDTPLLPSTQVVSVTTKQGQRLTGVLRNEDNFTLAVQSNDGQYHLLERSDLAKIDYSDHSLMPRDYATRLTPGELNDIVSFLVVTSRARKNDPAASAR